MTAVHLFRLRHHAAHQDALRYLLPLLLAMLLFFFLAAPVRGT